MKGRTQPPSTSESDDWGDESWTVDCPCGVNYDDGEEMVDCDECGVWVHTSCCRILKGHTSYVCDKCKFKKKKESEETEVAQLLVELPSKTPAFEERIIERTDFFPFRTPADLSMEERAHVQGIPGGDARLFVGVSPVFSRQLWKYTGYVPKAFRFNYQELPEWSQDQLKTNILLGDVVNGQVDNLAVGSESAKPEEVRPLEAEMQQAVEILIEHNQLPKEKQAKRELRGDSKHRHKVHALKEDKSQHHSKRRRDDSAKKDTSRKRVKNTMDPSQGLLELAKKASEEVMVSLRSSRNAPKNPKAMRKLAVQTFMDGADEDMETGNDCLKVEMLGRHESDALGYINGESGHMEAEILPGLDCSKPSDSFRNSSRDNLAESGCDERREKGPLGMPPSGYGSVADPSFHKDSQNYQKELEGSIHTKMSNNMITAAMDADVLPQKELLTDGGSVEAKTTLGNSKEILQSTLGVPKETVQRVRFTNSVASTKQQLEDVMDEPPDPCSGNGKLLQEGLSTSMQHRIQSHSVLPGKHLVHEEGVIPMKQQNLATKQPASTETHSLSQQNTVKHPEQNRLKGVKSNHQRHSSMANTARSSDEEQGHNQFTEQHVEELLYDSVDEQLSAPDESVNEDKDLKTKTQELERGTPSSPARQQEYCVSMSAAGHPHFEESPNTSPLSTQTAPLRSSSFNMSSSPTSSCPGVSSKQQGVTKLSSVSPPAERTGNVVLAQPVPASKVTLGSSVAPTSKAHASLAAKAIDSRTNVPAKNPASAKQRSRSNGTIDSKKVDVGSTITKSAIAIAPEGHASELGMSSSRHTSKEMAKFPVNNASKATALGKQTSLPASTKISSHSKAPTLLASKQSGQTAKQESGVPEQPSLLHAKQPSKPVLTSMPHKSEKSSTVSGTSVLKTSTVPPPPQPTGIQDRQFPVTSAAPPVLNDEELALLLHQELNSSPRVPRVARMRQTATAPQHLSVVQASYHSAKRPAGVSVPVASNASQKEHHSVSRRRMRDDTSRESSRGADDVPKAEAFGSKKLDDPLAHAGTRKDKDVADGCNTQKAALNTTADVSRHLSPGPGMVEASDPSGANDSNDGERRGSADNILTLPGLIEEILNEKGHQASYDYICEAVLPHWPKLRKHNGERYAYTSHRQAVIDCLRNRSAWSHLIDRGPKTNVGRKRRRPESIVAVESENAEEAEVRGLIHEDEGEDPKFAKSPKELEVDGSECWPPSDSGNDIDMSVPEEVPKGKRKARRRRRLAVQSKGYGARNRHNREDRSGEATALSEEDHERALSPLSEEAASNYSEEEEEILVHRGGRHVSRRQGSSIDSGEDEMDL